MTLPPINEDSYSDYMGTAPTGPTDPVAVRVVADEALPIEPRATRRWTCGQHTASTEEPYMLLGAVPSRVRATIKNLWEAEVYIAPTREECAVGTAFILYSGQEMELTTRHPIYVRAGGTPGNSRVAWFAEHLDG